MTQQLDRIIGARQAADAGPGEIAPIVMWSYLAALVKEYDALSARAERAEASLRSLQSWAEGARTDLADMTAVVAERDALRAQVRAVRAQAEIWRDNTTAAGFYPEASAYANAVETCGDALVDLLAESGLSLQEEQE